MGLAERPPDGGRFHRPGMAGTRRPNWAARPRDYVGQARRAVVSIVPERGWRGPAVRRVDHEVSPVDSGVAGNDSRTLTGSASADLIILEERPSLRLPEPDRRRSSCAAAEQTRSMRR